MARVSQPIRPGADMPITQLGLRSNLINELQARGVRRLADLASFSESDLRRMWGAGELTIKSVREWLAACGLELQLPKDPFDRACFRNRKVRMARTPPAKITPATELCEFGLPNRFFVRLWDLGMRTVADLARLTPRQLFGSFSKAECRQVVAWTRAAGLTLAGNPGPVELWRWGLLDDAEMEPVAILPDLPFEQVCGLFSREARRMIEFARVRSVADLLALARRPDALQHESPQVAGRVLPPMRAFAQKVEAAGGRAQPLAHWIACVAQETVSLRRVPRQMRTASALDQAIAGFHRAPTR